jgi:hypothetical protein
MTRHHNWVINYATLGSIGTRATRSKLLRATPVMAKNRTLAELLLHLLTLFTPPKFPLWPLLLRVKKGAPTRWLAISARAPPSGARSSPVGPSHGGHRSSGSHRRGSAARRRRMCCPLGARHLPAAQSSPPPGVRASLLFSPFSASQSSSTNLAGRISHAHVNLRPDPPPDGYELRERRLPELPSAAYWSPLRPTELEPFVVGAAESRH